VSLGNTRRLRESATMRRISSGENRTVSRLSAGLAGRRVAVSGFILWRVSDTLPELSTPKNAARKRFCEKARFYWAKTTRKSGPPA
jgi:hypothetical protein